MTTYLLAVQEKFGEKNTVVVEVSRGDLEILRGLVIEDRDRCIGPMFLPERAVGLSHIAAMFSTMLGGESQADLERVLRG